MSSSILKSLDMSLDDLIQNRKKTPDARPTRPDAASRGRGGGRAGKAGPIRGKRTRQRNQPYARPRDAGLDDDISMEVDDESAGPARRRPGTMNRAKGGRGGDKKGSIFSRLGSAKDSKDHFGTKIIVKNLKFDVLLADINELFSTVGEVTKAEIVYDRSGRSKGIAHVWFKNRASAEKAIREYDGRTLDQLPMQITMEGGKTNNVRQGLFGTALATTREDKDVKFKVNLGGSNGSGAGRGKAQRGRGRGRGGGGRGRGPSKTTEDLDNEMDTYMRDA